MQEHLSAEALRLSRQKVNQDVQNCFKRYRSLREACLSRLLALPVSQAIYVLDRLCPNPDAALARQLHDVNLADYAALRSPLVFSSYNGMDEVLSALEALFVLIPDKDRMTFWLSLAIAWIMTVPRRTNSLDGSSVETTPLVSSEDVFRGFLRSELMNRLSGLSQAIGGQSAE
jgi:hypothetical protein